MVDQEQAQQVVEQPAASSTTTSEGSTVEEATENTKNMSCGLYFDCPDDIQVCLKNTNAAGYHFIVTCLSHPRLTRNLLKKGAPEIIGRSDRILMGTDWTRLIVGQISSNINVDSEIEHIRMRSKKQLDQELGFAGHLGVSAISINLPQAKNPNLAHMLSNRFVESNAYYQVWVSLPMVHPKNYSRLNEGKEVENTWETWNDLRIYCNYHKRLNLMLELPPADKVPTEGEIDRWMGEPVKALVVPTNIFLINKHKQPVLPKSLQVIIKRFMTIDVQYIIKGKRLNGSYKPYNTYMNYVGRKLHVSSSLNDFSKGCEDFLQNPLQPLSDHLEMFVYEVFEKDQVKYAEYQRAIKAALEDVLESVEVPVIIIVGAGRGPLVQAALNASYLVRRKTKVYAVEKNPFAINTLAHRVKTEWNNYVTLVHEDMRTWEAPDLADILVSELLGSFGDNELSPECLDGAQRCLKKDGVSIPKSYTSFLAPLQNIKIHNEIKATFNLNDKELTKFETPYIVHLVNYYQLAPSQSLFTFEHPNWNEIINNERFKRLSFLTPQNSVLTGFIGFFETVLYKDIMLSINPQTYSKDMVSWFPIIFPLQTPVQVKTGEVIEVSFWRAENAEKVWYEWSLESPVRTNIMNPSGRSYFIKKHL